MPTKNPQPPKNNYTKCTACGLQWTDHPGISHTCHRLGRARAALKAIQIWAMTPNALEPGDVIDLCRRTLTDTEI